jgi:U3 small nucleolar RNA-associated protein 3
MKKPPAKSAAQSSFERNRQEAEDDIDPFLEGANKVNLSRSQDSDEAEKYDQSVSEPSDSNEDSEEGEEEDDDDDEEDVAEKRAKDLKDEANISKAWGKDRKQFYGAETDVYEAMGSDEEGVIEEEEEESRRLQAEAAEDLDEQDVDASSLEAILAAKPTTTTTNKVEVGFRDDELLSALKKDLSELNVEKLSKDVANMTKSEKLEVLKAESPDLLTLLEDAKPLLSELRNYLHPLILKVRELPKDTEGISFLELKHRLLLTYCTNLSFYLLLKAEGKLVKKHPVIKTLASLRTMCEKIRSIDSKLKYHVDKLLKMTTLGPNHAPSKKDPLSFKPNVAEMVPKMGGEQVEGAVYQAPKMTSVQFDADEKQLARDKVRKEKARVRAQKSGMLDELRNEFADRPQEIKSMGGFRPQADFLKEREQFEEDQFIRLSETKVDRKKRIASQKTRAHEDFDLGDFGDLHALSEATTEKQYGSKYDKIADKKLPKPKAKVPWEMDKESMEAGSALYESNKANRKSKKEAHKEAHPNRVYAYGKTDPNIVAEGTRRAAGGQIVKNRGLMRSRPALASNPRTAKRQKFDKAMVKRKSTVKEYKGKTPDYAGESSGIKTNVIKSTKL